MLPCFEDLVRLYEGCNGPNYIQGPVRVLCHPDPHGLDGNNDGWGCQ